MSPDFNFSNLENHFYSSFPFDTDLKNQKLEDPVDTIPGPSNNESCDELVFTDPTLNGTVCPTPAVEKQRRSDRVSSIAKKAKLEKVNRPVNARARRGSSGVFVSEKRRIQNVRAQAAFRQRKAERMKEFEKECNELRQENAFLKHRVPHLERELFQLKQENSCLRVEQQRNREVPARKPQQEVQQGNPMNPVDTQNLRSEFARIMAVQKRLSGDLKRLKEENEGLKSQLDTQLKINSLYTAIVSGTVTEFDKGNIQLQMKDFEGDKRI